MTYTFDKDGAEFILQTLSDRGLVGIPDRKARAEMSSRDLVLLAVQRLSGRLQDNGRKHEAALNEREGKGEITFLLETSKVAAFRAGMEAPPEKYGFFGYPAGISVSVVDR